jgi:hypothetical protein
MSFKNRLFVTSLFREYYPVLDMDRSEPKSSGVVLHDMLEDEQYQKQHVPD